MLLQYHGVKQDTEIRVHKESWPSRKKCSRCSCWDLNQRPFDHESDTVTIELSPLPMTQTLNTAIQSFYKTLKIMMMYHQGMFGDFWSTQMSVAAWLRSQNYLQISLEIIYNIQIIPHNSSWILKSHQVHTAASGWITLQHQFKYQSLCTAKYLSLEHRKTIFSEDIGLWWYTIMLSLVVRSKHKKFRRTLIYYDTDTQYAHFWEIPFVKPHNDS